MKTATLRIVAIYALCLPSVAPAQGADEDTAMLYPLFRFARYQDDTLTAESLAIGDNPFGPYLEHMPQADGAMKIDCRHLEKVGIVFNPERVGFLIYGKKYKVPVPLDAFGLSGSRSALHALQTKYTGWLHRDRLALNDWLVNGVLLVEASVSGEDVFSTRFELDRYKANLYGTPTAPSQIEQKREREQSPE